MKYLLLLTLLPGCIFAKYERDPETGLKHRHTNKRFYTGNKGCPEARDIEKDTLNKDSTVVTTYGTSTKRLFTGKRGVCKGGY